MLERSTSERSASEYPIHVWYKDVQGKVVDYVRKQSVIDADYFLCRELKGRIHRSETTEKTVTYFGPEGLVGIAVDTRI
jgi:hypothetical protein